MPNTAKPNIVLILNDDMGFSDLGCYGGEVRTPALDALAAGGVRFTQFYNTARCCPSRASLLTGLHPHQAGVGQMVQDDNLPGYRGDLSQATVTIAEALRPAGYATMMAGKWHVTYRVDEPNESWPCQRGCDRFYGFMYGAANYYNPRRMVRDNELVYTPPGDFYFTDAISDEAVRQIEQHQAAEPGRPFFQYVAYTAPHWPLHAPNEDIEKYKGRFDAGWDTLREQRLARMVEMGIIAAHCKLTERDPNVPPWKSAEHKEWEARRMEVYAAQIDRMDQGIGRIVDTLKRTGQWENTVVIFLADNGGCAEELTTAWTQLPHRSGRPETRDGRPVQFGNDPSVMPGGEETYQSYGLNWANLSNTPFREYKHWVHEGGIATPLIVHWPGRVAEPGTLRHTPAQLPDIMAMCLDAAGAEYPAERAGHAVPPCEGFSIRPIVERGKFGRDVLCWEHEGNCAIRRGKWKLVRKFPGDWELYDMDADRSETDDLVAARPDLAGELAALWDAWAERCNVMDWAEIKRLRKQRASGAGW